MGFLRGANWFATEEGGGEGVRLCHALFCVSREVALLPCCHLTRREDLERHLVQVTIRTMVLCFVDNDDDDDAGTGAPHFARLPCGGWKRVIRKRG